MIAQLVRSVSRWDAAAATPATDCTCGHVAEAHSHFHDRTYCGYLTCGCNDYDDGGLFARDVTPLWQVVAALACFVAGAVLAAAYWWAR